MSHCRDHCASDEIACCDGALFISDTSDLNLQDSWVLGFAVTPTQLVLRIQFVLLDGHPEYRNPRPGEVYCYREGLLAFVGFSSLEWKASGARAALGPEGEIDYGSVDSLVVLTGGHELEGDFGLIRVRGASLNVSLFPEA